MNYRQPVARISEAPDRVYVFQVESVLISAPRLSDALG